MVRVKSPQELGAAVVFLVIGLAGIYFGRELVFGTASRMGPGYFPTLLSWISSSSPVSNVTHSLQQLTVVNLVSYVKLFAGGRWNGERTTVSRSCMWNGRVSSGSALRGEGRCRRRPRLF